jgi:hypothetical protein
MSWLFMDLGPGAGGPVTRMIPQIIFGLLLFPLIARLCARLDRWRLP